MRMERIEKNGKNFILVPEKYFEKLTDDSEMLQDIRSYDLTKLKTREYYPAEIVKNFLAGENPIKLFRQYRKMTQDSLAKKSGITREFLSEIEHSKKQGSLRTIKKIAKALSVDVDELI